MFLVAILLPAVLANCSKAKEASQDTVNPEEAPRAVADKFDA